MKTKIYLLIFAVLFLFAGYTLYNNLVANKTPNEKAFKVEHFEKVTKILLQNRNGKEVKLEKIQDQWVLNDKYAVRQHLFEEMEEALTKMYATSIVSKAAAKHVVKNMIENAIKVKVYKGKKLDKVIYVGGPNLKNDATHMFLELNGKPSSKIYNVSLPGFRGYLTTRFVVNENEWRAKDIYSFLPNEIKEIKINYSSLANMESFSLLNKESAFSLDINGKPFSEEMLNQGLIVRYLKHFENQKILDYVFSKKNETNYKDSLFSANKYAQIEIEDTKGNKTKVAIINMPLHESSIKQYDENGDPLPYDLDYRYAVFGKDKDWGVVTNDNFCLALVSPYTFLKK